jgi:CRP-like cAMP-binding protein
MPTSSRPRRKKTDAKARTAAPRAAMPAHAHLKDADGRVVGGAALKDEEWILVLHGKPAASTDSPAMILAMLRHTAALLSRADRPVTLDHSDELSRRATDEAADAGKTLEEMLDYLEAERVARAGGTRGGSTH